MSADEGSVTIRLGPKVGLSFDNCDGIEIKSLKFLLSDKFEFGLMFSDTNDIILHDILISTDDENSTGCSAIISQGSAIRVSDSSFIGISGQFGAALLALSSSEITFTGSDNFTSNSAKLGGALYSMNSTLLFNETVSFIDNSAIANGNTPGCSYRPGGSGNGGAVYAYNSYIIMRGCAQFLTNEATIFGGAIAAAESILVINGSSCLARNEPSPMGVVFDSNSVAIGSGGAIRIQESEISIIYSTSFSNNYSPTFGGAVEFIYSSVILYNITATNNRANSLHGGALRFQFCGTYMDGYNRFENNYAQEFGGAIEFFNMLALNIAGESYFEGNSAQNGGAFDLYEALAATVVSGNMMFKNNSATHQGGAIYAAYSTSNFSGNNTFLNNSASQDAGGAVYIEGATVTLCMTTTDSETDTVSDGRLNYFEGNSAGTDGGAIHALNAKLLLCSHSTFKNNAAGGYGGAMRIDNTTAGFCGDFESFEGVTSIAEICVNQFEGNSAGTSGGAIVVTFASAKLYLCGQSIFKNNTADVHGGAIHIENASAVICGEYEPFVYYSTSSTLNSTNHYLQFEENRANSSGGAITAINNATVSFCGDNKFRRNKANFGGAISVINSTLNSTAYMEHKNNNATYRGGAVYVNNAKASFSGNNTFLKNHADQYGGAVYVENATVTFCMITELINVLHKRLNHFEGNSAGDDGTGGALDTFNSAKVYFCHDTTFKNNQAGAGGAFFSENSTVEFCYQYNHDSVRESNDSNVPVNIFEGNRAHAFGGAVSTYSNSIANFCGKNVFRNNTSAIGAAIVISSYTELNLECYGDCTFVDNVATQTGGAIYIQRTSQINIRAHRDIIFRNNHAEYFGGAIYSQDSSIAYYNAANWVEQSVSSATNFLFDRNTADSGGAIAMSGTAKLILNPQSEIIFTENQAHFFGGAIAFVDPVDTGSECSTMTTVTDNRPECFISFNTSYITLSSSQISLNFTNNNAEKRGNVLYGGRLNKCKLLFQGNTGCSISMHDQNNQCNDSAFEILKTISSISQESNSIDYSSNPSILCICNKTSINRCHCGPPMQISVSPGQTFTLALQTIDQYGNLVDGMVMSTQNNTDDYRIRHDAIITNLSIQDFNFSVLIGDGDLVNNTNSHINFALFLEGPCRNSTHFNITVQPCPFGFEFSSEIRKCHCANQLQRFTEDCNVDDITIGRSSNNFWISFTANNILLHDGGCPLDYCKDIEVYIPLNNPDVQCNDGRTGKLCGECKENYSLALGSLTCTQKCTKFHPLLILPIGALGILLIVLLFLLHMTVAAGTINGLLIYANIVQANHQVYLPTKTANGFKFFYTIFIGWLNLDLNIETCFYEKMDIYAYSWLQFLFPVYLWILMLIIILSARYYRRIGKSLGQNPVAVLATVLLISYAKLLKAIIVPFSRAKLERITHTNSQISNSSEIVWLFNGNTPYSDPRHVILVVFAGLILLFLFLPYTFLLLCGHWLQAKSHWRLFSWINKLKPFMDAYHAPFKKNERHWIGIFLLVRCSLFLTFALNAAGNPSLNLLIVTSVTAGISIVKGRIYEKWYNDFLESSFLLNLCILSSATFYVQSEKSPDRDEVQSI